MGEFNRDKKSGRRGPGRSSYRDSRSFSRDFDRPERREFRKEVEMHSATCSKCGARCEVPFRPTGNKPVYCNDCFRKGENFESRGPDQSKTDLIRINEKLDKILEILGRN